MLSTTMHHERGAKIPSYALPMASEATPASPALHVPPLDPGNPQPELHLQSPKSSTLTAHDFVARRLEESGRRQDSRAALRNSELIVPLQIEQTPLLLLLRTFFLDPRWTVFLNSTNFPFFVRPDPWCQDWARRLHHLRLRSCCRLPPQHPPHH